MLKDNNYYVPNKEDIFIGYECEIQKTQTTSGWQKHIWYDENFFDLEDNIIRIRTKYLSKEDIENEGYERQNNWFDETKTQRLGMIPDYKKETDFGSIRLYLGDFDFPHQYVSIEIYVKAKEGDVFNMSMKHFVYHGKIKSINEFRKLCKMLEI